MRIIRLHNSYQQVGGEDTSSQMGVDLLRAKGHQVIFLKTHNDVIKSTFDKIKAGVSAIYSPSSKRMLLAEIARFKPDLVHVHNFFPLYSPSLYYACSEAGIPVVQTLHNYRLCCPGAILLRDAKVCEDCLPKSFPWPGIRHGCYRNSCTQSAAVALMIVVHRWLGTWQKKVDGYIALTNFQKQKMIQAGLPGSKIYVKPNFIPDPGLRAPETKGEYILFVGRLSIEKGVASLIEAYCNGDFDVPLKIVGDGPLRQQLEENIAKNYPHKKVEFVGFKEKSDVLAIMRKALFLVFPSVWYEGFPRTLLEAFASGLPTITSRIGSMAEIIADNETGLLFAPGNSAELLSKITWALANPSQMNAIGIKAREIYEREFEPEANYQLMMSIYNTIINNYRSENKKVTRG